MSEQHSIAEARNNLPELIRRAEAGEAVELTRRGERVAVLIGRRQYERLVSKSVPFSQAWKAFSRDVDIPSLEIDPDEVFAGVRDDAPGRDTGL